jgi:hypothetical protein
MSNIKNKYEKTRFFVSDQDSENLYTIFFDMTYVFLFVCRSRVQFP